MSIGFGLVGHGAFVWALEHGPVDDAAIAASRILFTATHSDRPPHPKGHDHG